MTHRYLLITADDFGIGPATSRGVLDLAERGAITSTVLLVQSPFASESVAAWRRAGCRLELGWHPCLTLDRPVLPADRVRSLVDEAGQFLRLGRFLRRLVRGAIDPAEVRAEFAAQLDRFRALVGHDPANVNAHHHLHVFHPVGEALQAVLSRIEPQPYLRRVREAWCTLARVRGARVKRLALNGLGRCAARKQSTNGFAGADVLAGVTEPRYLRDPRFFERWLARVPGQFVELTCHPGRLDATLPGRDGSLTDGHVLRRPRELELLESPGFAEAVRRADFTLVTAAEMSALRSWGHANASSARSSQAVPDCLPRKKQSTLT